MSSQMVIFIKAVSRLLGWIYMLCWSGSFYPQLMSNYRRRATSGSTIDFPALNILGYTGYTAYTSCFLWSAAIRRQYAARHPLAVDPTVRFNDFAFAIHAAILSVITFTQYWPKIWGFKRSRNQRISLPVAIVLIGSLVAVAAVVFGVLIKNPDKGYEPSTWAWIDVLYTLSYIKILVTICKYIPQVWLNHTRQSTAGWSIWQILLDLAGGFLSLLQLVIDSGLQQDWSGITGNPVKLLLSNVTIFFDLIFVVQHYILYRHAEDEIKSQHPSLVTPLLPEPNDLSRGARV